MFIFPQQFFKSMYFTANNVPSYYLKIGRIPRQKSQNCKYLSELFASILKLLFSSNPINCHLKLDGVAL